MIRTLQGPLPTLKRLQPIDTGPTQIQRTSIQEKVVAFLLVSLHPETPPHLASPPQRGEEPGVSGWKLVTHIKGGSFFINH